MIKAAKFMVIKSSFFDVFNKGHEFIIFIIKYILSVDNCYFSKPNFLLLFLLFLLPLFSFGQLFQLPDKINSNKPKVYFEAQRTGNLNVLTWGGPEKYNYFLVQKSNNGTEFKALGKVKVTRKYKAKDFVFIDNTLTDNQDVYYRIIKYKKNGEYEYSEVLLIPAKKVCLGIKQLNYMLEDGFQMN